MKYFHLPLTPADKPLRERMAEPASFVVWRDSNGGYVGLIALGHSWTWSWGKKK